MDEGVFSNSLKGLRAMGTTIGCHTVIKKGTEGNEIKTYDLT